MINITSINYLPSLHEAKIKRRIARIVKGCCSHKKGYIIISAGPFRGKYLHQLIWQWTHPGETYNPAIHDIHHIDGDPTNFHPDNLERVLHRHHSRHTQLAGRLMRDSDTNKFKSSRSPRSSRSSRSAPPQEDEVPF